jgi:transcriptional regulator with XRE-family HTH domain
MKKKDFTASQMVLLKRIRENIIALRKKRDISQEELADLSNINRTYMGNIERCETNPSVLKLKNIAEVLGVDVSEFFKINKK